MGEMGEMGEQREPSSRDASEPRPEWRENAFHVYAS